MHGVPALIDHLWVVAVVLSVYVEPNSCPSRAAVGTVAAVAHHGRSDPDPIFIGRMLGSLVALSTTEA